MSPCHPPCRVELARVCLYVRGGEERRGEGGGAAAGGLTRIEMRAAFLCGGRSERRSCSEDRLQPFLSVLSEETKTMPASKGEPVAFFHRQE